MSDNYRKKPLTIQAWRWAESENQAKLLELLGMQRSSWHGYAKTDECSSLHIKTLEGNSYEVKKGDWIIRGVKGEFYPCKPDIFEATYELVD